MVITYNGNAETVNNIKDCLELLPDEIAGVIQDFLDDDLDYSIKDYKETMEEIQEVAETLRRDIKESKKLNRNIIIVGLEKIINKIVVM